MARKATRKDVLYAPQFGHERLVKTITSGGRFPCEYHLSESGIGVDRKVADDLLTDPHVVAVLDGLFPDPNYSQTFGWREDA